MLLTEGQISDYRGAAPVLDALPDADILIADRGYERPFQNMLLKSFDF